MAASAYGHYAMLRFNFFQLKNTYEYYGLSDVGRDCVVVATLLGFIIYLLGALVAICLFRQFFVELGGLIIRRYKDAQEWRKIEKYVSKFKKIQTVMAKLEKASTTAAESDLSKQGASNARDSRAQFKGILGEIESAISRDWSNMTYESTSAAVGEMEKLDKRLPAIDDIELQAKFEES